MPWEPLPGSSGREPARVGDSLDRLVRNLGAPSSVAISRLFTCWAEIAGSTLATISEPISLKGGILTIAVSDPAWVTQIGFLEPEILARVSEEIGDTELTGLEVRVRRTGR